MEKLLLLLRKNQRSLHIITFEAIIAFLTRYENDLQVMAQNILEEIKPFLVETDLELLAMALKTTNICARNASAAQLKNQVRVCFDLANSTAIQGKSLNEIHLFFEIAT